MCCIFVCNQCATFVYDCLQCNIHTCHVMCQIAFLSIYLSTGEHHYNATFGVHGNKPCYSVEPCNNNIVYIKYIPGNNDFGSRDMTVL